jgi:drug/metabolite transporter (DMT)-like permease
MSAIQSFMNAPSAATFAILVVAILLSGTGELFLKRGMNRVGELSFTVPKLIETFTTWEVLLGFALFFGGSLFWLKVISRADLSWAYPMLALGYVFVVLGSRFFLGEPVSAQRWLGTFVILVGVVIMYTSWLR